MQIGIGVTTYKRRTLVKKWIEKVLEHSPLKDLTIYIAEDFDDDRKGIAYRKNECLRALKNCDHVFLFDDDCYPIKDGWIDFFIKSKEDHLLFLSPSHNRHGSEGFTDIHYYNDCGGVFMYMTREAIDRVGAFNEKFNIYGFEHADYSNRIIGKSGNYPMLIGTEKYLFAHDYSTPNHKSSISDKEKKRHVSENWAKYFTKNKREVYISLNP